MRSRLSQRRRITRLVTTVALDEIEQSNLPCLHAAIVDALSFELE